jgi:hypothetical protein
MRKLSKAILIILVLTAPAAAWAQGAPPDQPGAVDPPAASQPSQPARPAFIDQPPRIPGILRDTGPIKITTAIDKAVIRVGDLIHYSMFIEAPPGSKVMMPPPGAQLGMFLIRDYNFPGLEEKEETWTDRLRSWLSRMTGVAISDGSERVQEFHFIVTAYDTGDLVIPPLPVMVVDPAGAQHALFAESARIRVAPVTNPEDMTIRDVKAPVGVEFPWLKYLPYFLSPLLIVIAIIVAVWLIQRRGVEEEEAMDHRPAHQVALEELKALEKEDLLAAGEYEKYYTRLSWILRKYMALRFFMYALEYTTTEIIEKLKYKDIEHGDHEKARCLLEEADMVKFARHEPALEERTTAADRVREIVERTKEEPPGLEEREAA